MTQPGSEIESTNTTKHIRQAFETHNLPKRMTMPLVPSTFNKVQNTVPLEWSIETPLPPSIAPNETAQPPPQRPRGSQPAGPGVAEPTPIEEVAADKAAGDRHWYSWIGYRHVVVGMESEEGSKVVGMYCKGGVAVVVGLGLAGGVVVGVGLGGAVAEAVGGGGGGGDGPWFSLCGVDRKE